MGILMCEICGQRFHKVSVLYWHQTTHNVEFKQFHKNTVFNIAFFSNWGSVSFCSGGGESGGGIGGQVNNSLVSVDQSGTASQHHTFSGFETVGPSPSLSAKQIDDYWEATMADYASRTQQQQINQTMESQGGNIVRQLNTMSLGARANDAIMRIAGSSGTRVDSSTMPVNFQRSTDSSTSALVVAPGGPQPNRMISTNYVPMRPAAVQGTRTPQQAIRVPNRSAVSALMKNLYAMKTANGQIINQMAHSRTMSLRQSNIETYRPLAVTSTPAIEKRGHAKDIFATPRQTYVEERKRRDGPCAVLGNFVQPAKKFVAATGMGVVGEKVQTQNKTVESNHGIRPFYFPATKTGKEMQRNGKFTKLVYGRVVPSTSPTAVSAKESVVSVAVFATGLKRVVVAKKPVVPPKILPAPPKTTNNETRDMKVTLAKLKKIVPTMPGTEYIMPDVSGIGSYFDESGKQLWTCLVCSEDEPEESSKDMICCDECDKWYHFECVGIMEDVAKDESWYCKICIFKVCGNRKDVFPEIFKND